jgi:hypothetical protein
VGRPRSISPRSAAFHAKQQSLGDAVDDGDALQISGLVGATVPTSLHTAASGGASVSEVSESFTHRLPQRHDVAADGQVDSLQCPHVAVAVEEPAERGG